MNGLSLKTVIPGRNKIPGIYSSNFDPTAHSTMPMLTRLAIGALVIQTATLDPQCVESCTLALWIKTCPADCDDSTWQSINIGPVVIPPDIHCVSGALVGNILHLVLTDGSTIDVDLSPLATDNNTFLTTLALTGTVLTATLNSGATVTVDLAPLIPVDVKLSALALAGTVLTATLTDGSTVTVDLAPLVYAPPAPVVIPPADAAAWADPLNPTDVEIQTWLTANPQAAGTLVILQGGGSVASPDHVWEVGPGAVLTHIEKPSAGGVVMADGVTITGDGSPGNPLVAIQPSPIGFRYTFSGLKSIPAPFVFTTVDYNTLVYNDGFTVNIGAGWNAVIPEDGYYTISAAAVTQTAQSNPGGIWAVSGGACTLQLELWVNGVRDAHLDYDELPIPWPAAPAANSQRIGLQGSITRKFSAGDVFNIRVYNGTGTNSNLDGYGFHDYVTCAKVA